MEGKESLHGIQCLCMRQLHYSCDCNMLWYRKLIMFVRKQSLKWYLRLTVVKDLGVTKLALEYEQA